MSDRRDLFPPLEPYRTGQLRLDQRHTMYWEESGNPHGRPILFLHGGPGAGATPVHRRVFPEPWRGFAGFVPEAERGDLLRAYHRRLIDPDPAVHMPAARAWSVYEGACSTLLPNPDTIAAFGEDRLALGLARIEAHFFTHHLFPPERDLVDRIDGIRRLPATIVQGRYDMVCPIRSADELARAWPEAEFIIVPDAGHSAMEPGIREQLVLAGERFKRL